MSTKGLDTTPSDVKKKASPAPANSNLQLLLGTVTVPRRKIEPAPPAEKLETAPKKRKRFKLRHAIIGGSFALCVAIPSVVTTVYMTLIAADQYSSTASFSVRNISGAVAASDVLGIFSQASGASGMADSFILMDYIKSGEMLNKIEANFDLYSMYKPRGLDFFFGMGAKMPFERRLAFWQSVVDVTFDHSSGIMTLELKAFNPKDAQILANFVMSQSEDLINQLSEKAQNEVLRGSQDEVQHAENRLMASRNQLREYRDVEQEIDPTQGAKIANDLIMRLEAKLSELNTALIGARQQMSDDSPRVKVLQSQISSIKEQIDNERQRLGTGANNQAPNPQSQAGGKTSRARDVASRIQRYEALQTEEEFATKTYASALVSLEKARLEANEKQRYLATFIKPAVSEEAQYPERFLDSLLMTLLYAFVWAAGTMIYYNIRDRA